MRPRHYLTDWANWIKRLLKRAARGWVDDQAMRLAAALSFYTMLSLGPLLLITLRITGLILGPQAAAGQLEAYTRQMVGPQGAAILQEVISRAGTDSGGFLATVISAGILVFSASYVFAELQGAMNTVWGVHTRERGAVWSIIRTRLVAFAMVLSLTFLLLVSLVISSALAAISASLLPQMGWLGQVADFIISMGVITGIFALLFKFIPDVEIGWRDVWLGAALTALLFTMGRSLLALYVANVLSVSIYGAAGSLVALLLWVYYSAMIVLFGAEFTESYMDWRRGGIAPSSRLSS